MASRRGPRELTSVSSGQLARDISATPEQRRIARVGVHKMFAIPAACLVMGLLSLPLGFTNRHGGSSSGFAISIGVIVAYYVLLSQGEDAARLGKLSPGLAMWLPDMLLLAIGLLLLVARNRDRSLLPRRLQRFLGAQWASFKRRSIDRLDCSAGTPPGGARLSGRCHGSSRPSTGKDGRVAPAQATRRPAPAAPAAPLPQHPGPLRSAAARGDPDAGLDLRHRDQLDRRSDRQHRRHPQEPPAGFGRAAVLQVPVAADRVRHRSDRRPDRDA